MPRFGYLISLYYPFKIGSKIDTMRQRDYIRQKDTMQCGVACLAMVRRILGAQYSLEFLTNFCHATTEGVSLKGMNGTINN